MHGSQSLVRTLIKPPKTPFLLQADLPKLCRLDGNKLGNAESGCPLPDSFDIVEVCACFMTVLKPFSLSECLNISLSFRPDFQQLGILNLHAL